MVSDGRRKETKVLQEGDVERRLFGGGPGTTQQLSGGEALLQEKAGLQEKAQALSVPATQEEALQSGGRGCRC